MTEPGEYRVSDFRLQKGAVLPEACLVYQTYGTLAADKSNVILYPTSYAAQHTDIEWLIGPDRVLDPTRYFIIIPNQLGNGMSTSPSHLAAIWTGPYPQITHVDNVTLQRRMLAEVFGIERLKMVYGWSMGAQQAYHWAVLFPEMVERITATCGMARTSEHNKVFLAGLRAAITTDPAWNGERFTRKPEQGLKAYGRIYAGWAMSQPFYREGVHLKTSTYKNLEEYLVGDWEAAFLRRDGDNLLSMLRTWECADVSDNDKFRGNLSAALASIRCPALVMPGTRDLYFTEEDMQAEARQIKNCTYRPIDSYWGHRAGNPIKSPEDEKVIRDAVAEFLHMT